MMYLDNYNASNTAPYGYLPSNDYRFISQIPQLEMSNNEAISATDQNPFRGPESVQRTIGETIASRTAFFEC